MLPPYCVCYEKLLLLLLFWNKYELYVATVFFYLNDQKNMYVKIVTTNPGLPYSFVNRPINERKKYFSIICNIKYHSIKKRA